jgi:abortive infection bacteriophage resistance protein
VSKIQFTKTALTPVQLLTKLKGQGLLVDSDKDALRYLQFVGGFRLKAYWYPYQDQQTKRFVPGIAFSKIIDQYEFDRGLRAVAFASIERLEIAIRTTMANRLAIAHGPHWYLKSEIFKPNSRWTNGQMLSKIEREVGLSERQAFIRVYNDKHDDPYIPQSWAVAECVSFGF